MQSRFTVFSIFITCVSLNANSANLSSAFTRVAAAPSASETQKITKAPPVDSPATDADVNNQESPVTIKKAVIESESAPGLKHIDEKLPSTDADDAAQPNTADDESAASPAPEANSGWKSTPKATSPAPEEIEIKLRSAKPENKKDAHGKSKQVVAEKSPAAPETSVAADTSLRWLSNGNNRYVLKHFRADGRMQADRDRTLESQHPHAIVLSCADSRVPTEIVFDQGIGEIFTVRAAGEALDNAVIASIEYAINHFHPKLLVVMGHTKCGAVEAALNSKEGESAGSEALDALLADIRPRLKSVMTAKHTENLEIESALNADGIARDLAKRSEIIRAAVASGDLTIKTALYHLDSGKVKFY